MLNIYLIIIGVIAFILTNFPLAILIKEQFRSDTFFSLFNHNPHQFLFLAAFFPVAIACIVIVGIKLNKYIKSKYHPQEKVIRKINLSFISVSVLGILLASLVSYLTRSHEITDLYKLAPEYARRAAIANVFVLDKLQHNAPPDEDAKRDLIQLPELRGHEGNFEMMFQKNMAQMLPGVLTIVNDKFEERELEDMRELLQTDAQDLKKKLHKAIPFLQLVFNSQLLEKLKNEYSELVLVNGAMMVASAVELCAGLVIVWHFLIFLLALILLKHRNEPGAPVDKEISESTYLLYTFVALISITFGLRIYTLAEINLVYGGGYGTMTPLLAGWILVIVISLYLFYITSTDDITKKITNLVPLIAGIATVVAIYLDPIQSSNIIGSNADWQSILILVITYLVILLIWFVVIFTRQAETVNPRLNGG